MKLATHIEPTLRSFELMAVSWLICPWRDSSLLWTWPSRLMAIFSASHASHIADPKDATWSRSALIKVYFAGISGSGVHAYQWWQDPALQHNCMAGRRGGEVILEDAHRDQNRYRSPNVIVSQNNRHAFTKCVHSRKKERWVACRCKGCGMPIDISDVQCYRWYCNVYQDTGKQSH